MSKVKLLITGNCGFIFSNFIRYVLKNNSNYSIVGIDALKNNKLLNTIYTNKGHTFYMGDITDSHFINNVFNIERPDIIIHGAVETHSSNEDLIKSNILGTQILLDATSKYNINRFIYISSGQIYGNLHNDLDKFAEYHTPSPKNLYSTTKISSEYLVENSGLKYYILRLCNVYGPRQFYNHFIPMIIKNIFKNEKIILYDDGMQLRDWIYVQDVCSAILKIVEKESEIKENILNISAGQEFTKLEVFHEICNFLETGYELLTFNKSDFSILQRNVLDGTLFKHVSSWQPQFKLRQGLAQTCQWYINNKWFLK